MLLSFFLWAVLLGGLVVKLATAPIAEKVAIREDQARSLPPSSGIRQPFGSNQTRTRVYTESRREVKLALSGLA